MTRQRFDEIFNLDLARHILTNNRELLKDMDLKQLQELVKRGKRKIIPKYIQKGINLKGREYPDVGLGTFSRKTRNTLAYPYYIDIDIKNASYTWIRALLKKYDIKSHWVEEYCENREELIKKYIMAHPATSTRDTVKRMYTSKLFNDSDKNFKKICDILIKKHKELFKKVVKEKEEEGLDKCPRRAFMAHCYQEWEFKTIWDIITLFQKNKIKCYADLHDGFYISKNTDSSKLQELFKKVKEEFGIDLVNKPMTDLLDIPMELIENFDKIKKDTDTEVYNQLKEQFYKETGCTKILGEHGNFAILNHDKTGYYMMNQSQLINTYNDWSPSGVLRFKIFSASGQPHENTFIHNYIGDPDKIKKDVLGFYPRDCPDYVFNEFFGFDIERNIIDDFSEQDNIDFQLIIDHFYKITNDGSDQAKECGDYLLNWISHIFQYPDKKTFTCLIIKGIEGCGKSIIPQLVGNMLGGDYYFESANPAQDIFKNFNEASKNKFLINFDESSNDTSHYFREEFKSNITCETKAIRQKFVNTRVCRDFTRYIITTNNEQPIAISDSNRRFVAFECTQPKYPFEELRKVIDAFKNKKAWRLLFDHMMKRDIEHINWGDFPKTRYYKRCVEESVNPIWLFIKYFVELDHPNEEPKVKGSNRIKQRVLYAHYSDFCSQRSKHPLGLMEFKKEIEITYLFTKKRTGGYDIFSFMRNNLINKLKQMGIFEEPLFLDSDDE